LNGANYIITPEQEQISLHVSDSVRRHLAQQLNAFDGYVVERHVMLNDYIIVNRQPTLWKWGLMAYRVIPMPGQALQFNPSSCTAFNLDFDGDEVNIHVVQNPMARAEVVTLCGLENNFLSGAVSSPTLALIQDFLEGAYFLNQPDQFFTYEEVCRLISPLRYAGKCMHRTCRGICKAERTVEGLYDGSGLGECPRTTDGWIELEQLGIPCILKPKALWSGRQLFSVLLPRINMDSAGWFEAEEKKFTAWPCGPQKRLLIHQGLLISGTLTKANLGKGHLGIVHVIAKDFGPRVAMQFMSDVQRLSNVFLRQFQMSVGRDDMTAADKVQPDISSMLQATYDKVGEIYTSAAQQADPPSADSLEVHVENVMSKGLLNAAAIVESCLDNENAIHTMATIVRSKGSRLNPGQILGCVGQQHTQGTRILPRGNAPRTSVYAPYGDKNPRHAGMIVNCYTHGLHVEEFLLHAVNGREGMTDTSVKTSETGYVARCNVKGLEGITVHWPSGKEVLCGVWTNGETRNAQSRLLAVSWGGGLEDTAQLEKVSVEHFLKMDDWTLLTQLVEGQDPTYAARMKEWQSLRQARDVLRQWRLNPSQRTAVDYRIFLPLDLERHVINTQQNWPRQVYDTVCQPQWVFEQTQHFCQTLEDDYNADVTFYMRFAVQYWLCTAYACKRYQLTPIQLTKLLASYRRIYDRARIHVGEAVGVQSAQVTSESETQGCLNTFHFIGQLIGARGGRSRLNELLALVTNIQQPLSRVVPLGRGEGLVARASALGAQLLTTTLADVTDSCTVERRTAFLTQPRRTGYISPHTAEGRLFESTERLHGDWLNTHTEGYFLRLCLNISRCARRQLTPQTIQTAILKFVTPQGHGKPGALVVAMDENNTDQWCVHVYIFTAPGVLQTLLTKERAHYPLDPPHYAFERLGPLLLTRIHLCGLRNIQGVHVMEVPQHTCHPVTGAYSTTTQTVVEIAGSNLLGLLGLTEIDFAHTITNNVMEVFHVLGKHAFANLLFQELKTHLSADGNSVNDHQLSIFVDFMTSQANPIKITRASLNHIATSGLMEKVCKVFLCVYCNVFSYMS
jgi:DNA-directed RNA polymerase II subunit RPB1